MALQSVPIQNYEIEAWVGSSTSVQNGAKKSAKSCCLYRASVLCPACCYFTALDGQPRPIQIMAVQKSSLRMCTETLSFPCSLYGPMKSGGQKRG
eukprot:6195486-Pleurochrysis_carterae.AAC.1